LSQLVAPEPDLRYDGHFIKMIVSHRDASVLLCIGATAATGRTHIDQFSSSATCIDMISADGTASKRHRVVDCLSQ